MLKHNRKIYEATDWQDWVAHEGRSCPLRPGEWVYVAFANGKTNAPRPFRAETFDWEPDGSKWDITHYRVVDFDASKWSKYERVKYAIASDRMRESIRIDKIFLMMSEMISYIISSVRKRLGADR